MRKRYEVLGLLGAVCLIPALIAAGQRGASPERLPGEGGYVCNNQRTGYCAETVRTPLSLEWVYKCRHAPRPAWPEPKWEVQRIDFDYVYQTAVDDERVYFGSSADHKVYALDLKDGHLCWEFFTQGPVRLAPAVADGRVFVTSDDGFLYCLDGRTGECIWKFRGGPRDEKLMGNEQMVSRWPGRSGALVEDGKLYTTFGMWSRDGVYIYCLNAADGSVIWKNSTANFRYTKVPHGEGMAGAAPQGYLALYKNTLIVAAGRAEPVFFDARTGKLIYLKSLGITYGGAWLMATHDRVFFHCGSRASKPPDIRVSERPGLDRYYNDIVVASLNIPDGTPKDFLCPAYRAIVSGERMVLAVSEGSGIFISQRNDPDRGYSVVAVDMKDVLAGPTKVAGAPRYQKRKMRETFLSTIIKWRTRSGRAYAMLQAGDTVFVGGEGNVAALNAADGKPLWQADVEGDARGLSVAVGRLIVSTTDGLIYCFASDGPKEQAIVHDPEQPALPADGGAAERAPKILSATAVREGYCLLLGAGDGRLAAEMARQSKLLIYCIEPDASKAARVRKMLDAAGLYGVRVTVHDGGPGKLPHADYFADLIVADGSLAGDLRRWSANEAYRVLRPYGGMLYAAAESNPELARQWVQQSGARPGELHAAAGYASIVRGRLPGAGEWTHQYADAGRTSASNDTVVQPPLKMLWWGRPGPAEMVARHWRGPSPLFSAGRLFIQGENVVIAQDAYNGRILWRKLLPGVAHFPHAYRGGNISTDGNFVYALQGLECLQLAAATGRTVRKFRVPLGRDALERMQQELRPVEDLGGLPRTNEKSSDKTAKKSQVPKGYYCNWRYDPVPRPPEWDFLAVSGKTLVGTVAVPNLTTGWWRRAFPEGKLLFAFDTGSGKLRWTYQPVDSISPNCVSLSEDRVFLIDRISLAQMTREERAGRKPTIRACLKALDLVTGRLVWENDKIADNMRSLWRRDDVLLLSLLPPSGSLGAIKRTLPQYCMGKPAIQA